MGGDALEFGTLTMGLFGGLAIFLYGMEKMTEALKRAAGSRMKSLLARMTTNRFKGVLAGAFITATIQSSSVTTVLVVGFISAGLLSLSQSVPIIMGAEIGTTITAQIIAFKVTKHALWLVVIGFAMAFVSKRRSVRLWGQTILGLGLIFFGMSLMKGATSPLKSYEPFVKMMQNMDNALLAVLFSAMFTGLIQSSSATTGVIIVLASQGFISLEAGIALVFGANIGTCVTAFLASIGKPREAVRAAMVHILFNSAGVLLWLGLIPMLAEVIRDLSPVAEGLTGVAKLKAETPRQIANAHTLFNVSNTLIFIGFTPLIARLVERLLPDRDIEDTETSRRYLDDILVHTPSLALDVVRMELGRLGAAALAIVKASPGPTLRGTDQELDDLRAMDNDVDLLHGALVTYMGRLSLENLSEPQSHRLSEYIAAANYFENIGDMIETNLVDAGKTRLAQNLEVSEETQQVLTPLYERVVWAVETAIQALVSDDKEAARSVRAAKSEVNALADSAEAHLAKRLTAEAPNRLEMFRLESELIEAMKRIYYFAKRIARLVEEETAPYTQNSVPTARSASPVS